MAAQEMKRIDMFRGIDPGLVSKAPMVEIEQVRTIADRKQQAHQIARQFEALLIEEVIRSARTEGSGWLGDDADETSESVAQMGEQFLAKAVASGSGFGLAAQFAPLIERQLAQDAATDKGHVTPGLGASDV